ncbi:MAG: hypothetical protein Q7T08_10980, partial [Devosia sp.]|nr:hypothetical protein [Devosia sp.]
GSGAQASSGGRRLMSKSDEKAAREQRLATKLRENLKRRKGQARARKGPVAPDPQPAGGTKAS